LKASFGRSISQRPATLGTDANPKKTRIPSLRAG